MCCTVFLIKTFVILWILSVVVECERQKRDVHHRIILTEKVPRRVRSHNRGQTHHHNNHHHNQNKHHGHKKGRYHHSDEKDTSNEDYDNSHSQENSYEDSFEQFKGPHHQPKHTKKAPSPLSNFNSGELNSELFRDESRLSSFKEERAPLLSTNKSPSFSIENHRGTRRKPRKESKKPRTTYPIDIEITTSYPYAIPFSSFQSTNYPPLNSFTKFNQKNIESDLNPLIGTIEQVHNTQIPILIGSNDEYFKEKSNVHNHKISYEVREPINEDPAFQKQLPYHELYPLIDMAKAHISAEETAARENEANLIRLKKNSKGRSNRGRKQYFDQ